MKATPGGKGSAVFMLLFFLLLFSLQLHAQLPDGLKVTKKKAGGKRAA